MARGRGHMARRPGRVRYSWHGFYLFTPLIPPDIFQDIFVLYDPIDDDHQEEVVLERIRGTITLRSESTNSTTHAMGLYIANRNAGGTFPNPPDPEGVAAFDIESNWTLWHRFDNLAGEPSGQVADLRIINVDVKARRKIQDPQVLILVTDRGTASASSLQFDLRCLLREGRF